ncbi:MAG: hypothetical protein ABII89_03125 [Candidatus Omnitrophota bacterium]
MEITKENDNRYVTKDLFESACLFAKGRKLVGLESTGSHYLFVFAGKKACEKIALEYCNGDCSVNARGMADAVRRLKDLLFSKK